MPAARSAAAGDGKAAGVPVYKLGCRLGSMGASWASALGRRRHGGRQVQPRCRWHLRQHAGRRARRAAAWPAPRARPARARGHALPQGSCGSWSPVGVSMGGQTAFWRLAEGEGRGRPTAAQLHRQPLQRRQWRCRPPQGLGPRPGGVQAHPWAAASAVGSRGRCMAVWGWGRMWMEKGPAKPCVLCGGADAGLGAAHRQPGAAG